MEDKDMTTEELYKKLRNWQIASAWVRIVSIVLNILLLYAFIVVDIANLNFMIICMIVINIIAYSKAIKDVNFNSSKYARMIMSRAIKGKDDTEEVEVMSTNSNQDSNEDSKK